MGKRIIQQARGKGSSTYRVSKKAFKYQIKMPKNLSSEGTIVKLVNSRAHTCPLAKVQYEDGVFYIPAFKGMVQGQKISFEGKEISEGSVRRLVELPLKTKIYNIESKPRDEGKFIKSGGSYAIITRIVGEKIFVLMPSKKEKGFHKDCRAVVGIVAGSGRLDKPVLKAGKKYHIKKTKSKLWPRTSAVKVNAIDHPFGSGRGKNPKSKIAKRNSAPGQKVGLLRPRRTGKRK
jgi:large subunit ribosomal protein L2